MFSASSQLSWFAVYQQVWTGFGIPNWPMAVNLTKVISPPTHDITQRVMLSLNLPILFLKLMRDSLSCLSCGLFEKKNEEKIFSTKSLIENNNTKAGN